MKQLAFCALLLLELSFLSAPAQQSPAPTPPRSDQRPSQPSAMKMQQPGPEMRKLLAAVSGKWINHFSYEPSERRPNGGTAEGQAVFRPGPGGLSMLEDETTNEPGGETSGISVTWWDAKAQGYRAIWCDDKMPNGCIVMSRLANWEGDDFVLGDEFTRDGKKFVFREVVSDITATSFTQTLSQGEAGKELKRLVTIHAIRANEGAAGPIPKSR